MGEPCFAKTRTRRTRTEYVKVTMQTDLEILDVLGLSNIGMDRMVKVGNDKGNKQHHGHG